MCVDFAYKQREQEGDKWALRNIKLRISRKMLFVKGLLMCFSHYGQHQDKAELIQSLNDMVKIVPLELIIGLQEHFSIPTDNIVRIINCYSNFLSKIDNDEIRTTLLKVNMNDIYGNAYFLDLRNTADELQNALDNIFLINEGSLKTLTLKYGIF